MRGRTASGCLLHRGGWGVDPPETRREDSSWSRVIAYRGWKTIGQLVGKRLLQWHTILGGLQVVVSSILLTRVEMGGDEANWSYTREWDRAAVFQLDGSARACGRGADDRSGGLRWNPCRINGGCARDDVFSSAPTDQKSTKRRAYIESNLTRGMDWRKQVSDAPPDARSLGTMESNGDKLIANRMKKRGMSWTIRGAHRMAKVVQLVHNGELAEFCRSQTRVVVRLDIDGSPRAMKLCLRHE